MTNNIEKLYELAGVEKELVCNCSSENLRTCKATKKYCCYSEFEYTFTDTKQLELIKWLAIKHSNYSILHIDKYCDYFRVSFDKDKTKDDIGYELDYAGYNTDFSQALAGLVCELWEDLTDEQKKEVRKILCQ